MFSYWIMHFINNFCSIFKFSAYISNINFKGVIKVDKQKKEKSGQVIPCALLHSKICPKPKECDGINRLCSAWKNHSGR